MWRLVLNMTSFKIDSPGCRCCATGNSVSERAFGSGAIRNITYFGNDRTEISRDLSLVYGELSQLVGFDIERKFCLIRHDDNGEIRFYDPQEPISTADQGQAFASTSDIGMQNFGVGKGILQTVYFHSTGYSYVLLYNTDANTSPTGIAVIDSSGDLVHGPYTGINQLLDYTNFTINSNGDLILLTLVENSGAGLVYPAICINDEISTYAVTNTPLSEPSRHRVNNFYQDVYTPSGLICDGTNVFLSTLNNSSYTGGISFTDGLYEINTSTGEMTFEISSIDITGWNPSTIKWADWNQDKNRFEGNIIIPSQSPDDTIFSWFRWTRYGENTCVRHFENGFYFGGEFIDDKQIVYYPEEELL